ncbi:MAG: hypothetical protein ACYCY2_02290 [Acidithiobacillus ferriphilus]
MTILDAHEYADPLEVAIARESRTCKGCWHIQQVRALGTLHQVCSLYPQRDLAKKCRSYQGGPAE